MKGVFFKILRYSGLPFLFREVLQRNKVTILIMHDITPSAAKQAFLFWKNNYNLISFNEYRDTRINNKKLLPKSLILTLDDGHKGNYRLLPLLNELHIPVTIFLCSDIAGTQRHFWFINKDIDIENLKEVTDEERIKILNGSGFTPEKEYPDRHALSKEEIMDMKSSSFIDLQSHTKTHPILTKCTDDKVMDEIINSKKELENKFHLNINGFAYPNGYYGQRETMMTRKAGYSYALTADAGFNTLTTDLYKLKRLSVNDSEDINEIIVKSSGVWGILKRAVLRF